MNIMNIDDVVFELMKHMKMIDLVNFSMCCISNYKKFNILIDTINEDEFLKSNNIIILNKSYEFYINLPINYESIKKGEIKYNCKRKKEYIKYEIDKTRIKLHLLSNINRFTISGNKSKSETIIIIDKFLKLLYNQIPVYSLIPISTTLRFYNDLKHKNYEGMHINNRHSHLTVSILRFDIFNDIKYIKSNKKIEVVYKNFKTFYLTYNRFVI